MAREPGHRKASLPQHGLAASAAGEPANIRLHTCPTESAHALYVKRYLSKFGSTQRTTTLIQKPPSERRLKSVLSDQYQLQCPDQYTLLWVSCLVNFFTGRAFDRRPVKLTAGCFDRITYASCEPAFVTAAHKAVKPIGHRKSGDLVYIFDELLLFTYVLIVFFVFLHAHRQAAVGCCLDE